MSEHDPEGRVDTSSVDAKERLLLCAGGLALVLACLLLDDDEHGDGVRVVQPREAQEAQRDAAAQQVGESLVRREVDREADRGEDDGDDDERRRAQRELPGPREVLVAVRDHQGEAVPGLELVLEGSLNSGVWAKVRVLASDGRGVARFTGLHHERSHRVGARYPSAPDAVEVLSDDVSLTVQRPSPALVELRASNGYALSGARRVVFQASGTELCTLTPAKGLAQWTLPVVQATPGVLHITDTLGRQWSVPIELSPEAISVATPGDEWIAIARPNWPGTPRNQVIQRERLRWSLALGNQRERSGSGWLDTDGGFHALVPRAQARTQGGRLELRWHAPQGEQQLLCWWFADSALEHISLQPAPIGEVVSLSRRNSSES